VVLFFFQVYIFHIANISINDKYFQKIAYDTATLCMCVACLVVDNQLINFLLFFDLKMK